MIVPITDHFLQALGKLIQRYKGKPRFAALLGTYIKQVQDLEDATRDVEAGRDVDTADDTRLQVLGRLVGQTRPGGASLEQFRLYVKARILANRSDGSPEALKEIARLVLGQGTYLREDYLFQELEARGPLAAAVDPTTVADILYDAHTAGVGHRFIAQFETDGFIFSGDVYTVDSAHGFSSEALSDGGYLTGIW